jgi:hypothetical protein
VEIAAAETIAAVAMAAADGIATGIATGDSGALFAASLREPLSTV